MSLALVLKVVNLGIKNQPVKKNVTVGCMDKIVGHPVDTASIQSNVILSMECV